LEAEKYIQSVEPFLYGRSGTEKDLKGMKSTTSILIRRMTELKTCNACLEETIDFFMEDNEKIIKLLMELSIESAKLAENIKFLMNFGKDALELIVDIANHVHRKSSRIGEIKTGENTTNICGNTEGKKPNRFIYTAKASRSERGEFNDHPTVKPLKLMEYLLNLLSYPTDIITIDPFLGSGTTAVACENLKRRWIGIEKEEKYCEIAARRIEAAASQKSFEDYL
jgi:DNA modification methylase